VIYLWAVIYRLRESRVGRVVVDWLMPDEFDQDSLDLRILAHAFTASERCYRVMGLEPVRVATQRPAPVVYGCTHLTMTAPPTRGGVAPNIHAYCGCTLAPQTTNGAAA